MIEGLQPYAEYKESRRCPGWQPSLIIGRQQAMEIFSSKGTRHSIQTFQFSKCR